MFSKKQRLNRQEIEEIFKNPEFSFKNQNLDLKGKTNKLPFPRFCVVIPKKTEKGSVKRHFLKRKIFAALEKIETGGGLDLVFYIKNKPKEWTKEEIQKDLDNLLKKCIIDK